MSDPRSPGGGDNTPPRPGTLGRDPAPGHGPDGLLAEDFRVQAPSVSLPKGGGAIGGIGEKVSANPVTGSASVSIPLPITSGRAGFTPALGLSYDSGAGNGPFGLGWRLTRPSVRRKTDKGLPQYRDSGALEDIYVLSDTEDLVPLLEETAPGVWETSERTVVEGSITWDVQRYRPRVEGAFALIERWRSQTDGDIYWRTISRDNVKRLYGKNAQARVDDPDDSTRVFEWLLEQESDELGNIISYQYVEEDRTGVSSHPAEARRGTSGHGVTYAYLKRVSYANTVADENPDDGGSGAFRFHLVFDYGEHDATDPAPDDSGTWSERQDAFSSFRSGFDVRCHRLCERVLMFHEFLDLRDDGAGGAVPAVVRSVELTYDDRPTVTTLASAQVKGWKWTGSAYDTATLPQVDFAYAQPTIDETVRFVEGLDELPNGLDLKQWRFVDLDGEGLNGLLTELGGGWFYKRNNGAGSFAPARRLGSRPNLALAAPGVRLVDLDGDGRLDLVSMRPGVSGSQARSDDGWTGFRPFRRIPTRAGNPDARLIDLDGDGHADLLLTENEAFTWYPSEARDGFGDPRRVPMAHDEDDGPRLVFSREGEQVFLADMSGDGLADLVRIRSGSISYWPNRGYGQFGARIQMKGAPRFDDRFDPSRLRLSDIDGSGPTDLLYVGPDAVRVWFNQAGNGFAAATTLSRFPPVARPNEVQVADLLGDGTACLVWSSPLLHQSGSPLRYVKLMSEGKPWLMSTVTNNLGRVTRMSYTPSTSFYVDDRRDGTPWATRLPFPVQCLSKLEQVDQITGWRFVNEYAYHHGYFDGAEREFRGFGMVEQWDTETVSDYDETGTGDLVESLPPVRTRTWFHTGAWEKAGTLSAAYASEYSGVDTSAHSLDEPSVPTNLTPQEIREAHRALKGRILRQEVYAEDGSGQLETLYTTAESTWNVVQLQPANEGAAASFRVDASESLSYVYDVDVATGTPDPRVSHSLTIEVDDYGVATRTAAVSYPRRGTGHDDEQAQLTILVSEVEVVHQDDRVVADDIWRLAVPIWQKTWEVTDTTGTTAWTDDGTPATATSVDALFGNTDIRAFEADPATSNEERRLVGHQATLYWNDGLTAALALGSVGVRRFAYESYALAFTEGSVSDLIADRYGTRVTSTELAEGGYVDLGIDLDEDTTTETNWWVPSGRFAFDTAANFYAVKTHTDPFGNVTEPTWDADRLAITELEDAAGLVIEADIDYGLMVPITVTDQNGTEAEATFDALGRVTKTAVRNGSDGDGSSAHSAEFAYSTDRWSTSSLPNRVHVKLLKEHGGSDWQESYAYSDGGGRVVQTKVQAAPGDAPERDVNGDLVFSGGVLQFANANPRWVGTGRTVVDNKGNVVKQYEPFFSSLEDYEDEDEVVEWGVSIVYGYDPVGRNTLVTLPDDNTRSWTYTPWSVSAFDEEDNLASGDHEDTPAVTHMDVLGRVYKLVETPDGTTDYETTLELDVQGSVLTVTDPRGNDIQVQAHDVLGRPAFMGAADEGYDGSSGDGESRVLLDVTGQPIRTWRSGSLELRRTYDDLRRPLGLYVDEGSGEVLAQYSVYGDALTSSIPAHSKGRLLHSYDTAGRVTFEYDFRGRVLEQGRQVFSSISTTPDWDGVEAEVSTEANLDTWSASLLESETFTVSTSYDALDRVTEQTAPDTSKTEPTYDEGGRLTAVDFYLHGASTVTQAVVTEITYNARGQRESITYGNNTSSTYTYDENRLWLATLKTTRSTASSHGGATLQELSYTRDAVGNITLIEDAAQDTPYFSNTQVTSDRTFTYDSLYRLAEGTGREKVSQTQSTAFYADYAGSKGGIKDSGNPALRVYTQSYLYDEAGNITEMKHAEGATVHWKRGYDYETDNNQLRKTSLPGDTYGTPSTYSSSYSYNERGAMVFLPHLKPGVSENLTRDFRDQLRKADLNSGGDVAWYAYDAGGNRVRKYVDKGSVTEERIYIGAGWEVWRKRNGSGTLTDERETLHAMDDQRRVAMVEHDTQASTTRYRFQLDDHLGTASVETEEDGGVVTYEEFHPYGTTAWWARSSSTDVSAKRYRYTGQEKDEETGLSYHRARYLLTWVGRWDGPDPSGLADGGNRFGYASSRPISASDTGGRATLVLPSTTTEAADTHTEIKRQMDGGAEIVQFTHQGLDVVVVSAGATPAVVQRRKGEHFTDAAKRMDQAGTTDVVINTNLFEGSYPFLGADDPANHPAQGLLVEGGAAVGGKSSPLMHHVVWNEPTSPEMLESLGMPAPTEAEASASAWTFGVGDPPASSDFAIGGAAPIIIGGLQYGDVNTYVAGAPAGLPATGDPGAANQKYLTQRSSATFAFVDKAGPGLGFPIFGIDRDTGLVFIVVQEDGTSPGMSLSEVRDSLVLLGVDDAVMWDGSTSATLVVDQSVDAAPMFIKDDSIPYGLQLQAPP